jgi:hypothetical protein
MTFLGYQCLQGTCQNVNQFTAQPGVGPFFYTPQDCTKACAALDVKNSISKPPAAKDLYFPPKPLV